MTTLEPVVKRVMVACPPPRAFAYFTADMARWWPMVSHSCSASGPNPDSARSARCVFECREGGRIRELAADGREYEWGTVVVWDPPARVVFTWHPGRTADEAQQVEVVFTPAGAAATEVVLTHTGWDRRRDGAAARASYDSGWELVFVGAYRDFADGGAIAPVGADR